MDEAVAAALAQIKRASAAHTRAEAAAERTRTQLHDAIVEAFRAGARPVDVDAVSPYDRNHNARLRKAAGVPGVRDRATD